MEASAFLELLTKPPHAAGDSPASLEQALLAGARVRGTIPMNDTVIRALESKALGGNPRLAELESGLGRDPLVALRVISSVNRTFYQRGEPILTLEQAVRRLGTRRLVEVVRDAGSSTAPGKLFAANVWAALAFQDYAVAALFAESIGQYLPAPLGRAEDLRVGLALFAAPLLALAWSRPDLYSWVLLRAQASFDRSIDTALEPVLGLSRAAACLGVARGLLLPEASASFLSLCSSSALKAAASINLPGGKDLGLFARVIFFASHLAHEYLRFSGRAGFENLIREAQQKLGLPAGSLLLALTRERVEWRSQLQELDLLSLDIPEARLFSRSGEGNEEAASVEAGTPPSGEARARLLGQMVRELGKALREGSEKLSTAKLSQAVWLTLSTLVRVIGFDRAALLGIDMNFGLLKQVVAFGVPSVELSALSKKLLETEGSLSPEVQACAQRKAVFTGRPISLDAGEACAFPVVCEGGVQAVFYAERLGLAKAGAQSLENQVAVVAVAECWRDKT